MQWNVRGDVCHFQMEALGAVAWFPMSTFLNHGSICPHPLIIQACFEWEPLSGWVPEWQDIQQTSQLAPVNMWWDQETNLMLQYNKIILADTYKAAASTISSFLLWELVSLSRCRKCQIFSFSAFPEAMWHNSGQENIREILLVFLLNIFYVAKIGSEEKPPFSFLLQHAIVWRHEIAIFQLRGQD